MQFFFYYFHLSFINAESVFVCCCAADLSVGLAASDDDSLAQEVMNESHHWMLMRSDSMSSTSESLRPFDRLSSHNKQNKTIVQVHIIDIAGKSSRPDCVMTIIPK